MIAQVSSLHCFLEDGFRYMRIDVTRGGKPGNVSLLSKGDDTVGTMWNRDGMLLVLVCIYSYFNFELEEQACLYPVGTFLINFC